MKSTRTTAPARPSSPAAILAGAPLPAALGLLLLPGLGLAPACASDAAADAPRRGDIAAEGGSSQAGAAAAERDGSEAGAGGEALSRPAPSDVIPADEPCDGYTLIGGPEGDWGEDFGAFLIDMAGNVVHQWELAGFPPKMLPGGNLVGCQGLYTLSYDCMELQEKTWDGELLWSFSGWASTTQGPSARHHHDFQRAGNSVGYYAPGQTFEPRGHTLVLAHLAKTVPEIRDAPLDDDVIYEVDAEGKLTGFAWHGADHIAQFGFDERALADIRTRRAGHTLEWLHGNAISRLGPNRWFDQGNSIYHPQNILYSSRQANFLALLDHQTGDVVWRVGPDFAGRPEQQLGQFSGQHMAHMIPQGLPGAGNILVYDNGGTSGFGGTDPTGSSVDRYFRGYSRVVEFDPTTLKAVWHYGEPSGDASFYTNILGAVQRLPNGNTLITLGVVGTVIEVTPKNEVVWQYQFAGAPVEKGTATWIYRAQRVPPEWLPAGVNAASGDYPAWAEAFRLP